MCGIAGLLARDPHDVVDQVSLERMTAALVHRGPDSAGVHVDGPVGLGHRRLAIIDLSAEANQPMANEDGSVVLVANGEIYNHRELRRELSARGHRFRSDSDCEVILHLYEERGAQLVDHLRGMFAFAVWDRGRGRLLLARDRLGQKPLYYTWRPDGLAFASELRALLVDERTSDRIDLVALDAYLALQYVPAPHTIFEGVHSLPPGYLVEVGCGQSPAPRRYWRADYTPQGERLSVGEVAAEVRSVVERAVAVRLMSDVPLGAFLSGGVDSAIVVACMARASAGPVKTFSIGFDRARDSELPYARMVADRWQTDHHEAVVRPDMTAILPAIARQHGQPFADPSAVPMYYLCELARRHVTVALSGDGGDESFGGYRRYVWAHVADQLRRLPGPLLRATARIARATPTGSGRWVRLYGEALTDTEARRYLSFIRHFSAEEKAAIYTDELAARFVEDQTAARFAELLGASRAADARGRLMNLDIETYLPGDILTKVDIASMTHSLEARSPLVDHEVVSMAAALPSELKLRGLRGKWIFKRAFEDVVPGPILARKKKGFSMPLMRWFRNELRELAYDELLSQRAVERGLFRAHGITDLLERHQAGEDHGDRLWNLLALELWFREIVDGRGRLIEDATRTVAAGAPAARVTTTA